MESLASAISGVCVALELSYTHKNEVWINRWESVLDDLASELPHGAGFSKTQIDHEECNEKSVILHSEFRKTDDNGDLVCYIEYDIEVEPSFNGIYVYIKNKSIAKGDDIDDYVHNTFKQALESQVDVSSILKRYRQRG